MLGKIIKGMDSFAKWVGLFIVWLIIILCGFLIFAALYNGIKIEYYSTTERCVNDDGSVGTHKIINKKFKCTKEKIDGE